MVFWDGEGLLDVEGGFNQCCNEAAVDVPFDVAVEEPDARIVSFESEDEVALRVDGEGISPHGRLWEGSRIGRIVGTGIGLGACHGLESVAVEMEGVLAWVVAVEDEFDDVVLLEDECFGAAAIDGDVVCGVTGGHDGVKGRNLRTDIGGVVEEGTEKIRERRLLDRLKHTNWLHCQGWPS